MSHTEAQRTQIKNPVFGSLSYLSYSRCLGFLSYLSLMIAVGLGG